jgi:hypothetical protein
MPIPRKVNYQSVVDTVRAQLPREVNDKVGVGILTDAFNLAMTVVMNDREGNKYSARLDETLQLPDWFVADLCLRVA